METGASVRDRSEIMIISREGGQNMSKRFSITVLLIAGIVAGPAMAQSLVTIDPTTVDTGHVYLFEDVSGSQLPDDSANVNTGTIVGAPQVVEGLSGAAMQFDGVDDGIHIPDSQFINVTGGPFPNRTVIAVFNCADVSKSEKQTVFEEGGLTRGLTIYVFEGEVYVGGWNKAEYDWNPGSWISAPISSNEWHAVALVIRDGAEAEEDDRFEMWMDGTLIGKAPGGHIHNHSDDNAIGYTKANIVFHDGDGAGDGFFFEGIIDEVWILNDALTEAELGAIGLSRTNAGSPVPANGAIDVLRDEILTWEPGEFAKTHDVYFGTAFDDVNDADRGNPMDVLASQDQTAATYDPGRLEFGQTYYWRIDEVNGAPDNTIFKGEVWNFEVEPLAIAIENIIVTASSADPGAGPENTVNGSGVDENDLHTIEAADMWLSSMTGEQPTTIEYAFDKAYKLHEMLIWNYNVQFEVFLGYGFKDVTVEYSENGADWIVLGDLEFAQATSMSGYAANTTIDFAGMAVHGVRLTAHSNWGGLFPQFGLSEVRFMHIPIQAREPQPGNGQTGVDVSAALAWRAGREAGVHEVYLSTDGEAVANGTALVDSIGDNSYVPGNLEFGANYYWKINEVNEAEAIGSWEGDVWMFRTVEFSVIEDFESYDDDENRIYDTWIDGFGIAENGSQVGYLEAPFAETTIVNGGSQSMPLHYDNTGGATASEAEKALGGLNLTANGADSLRLFVSGLAPAFYEGADGSILMNAIGVDIWGTADEFRYAYKQLTGDGSMIALVEDLDASPNGWVKAGVMVRQNTDAGAINAFVAMTGGSGGGATFQQRVDADGSSVSEHTYEGNPFAPPYWVRIDRAGNAFSAFISPDGETWTQAADTVTVDMADPVLIGLALTSHLATQATSAEFSNVSFTGNVSGAWQIAEIGATQPAGNDPQPIYVALGNSVVIHPDAAITARSGWTEWVIPLSEFGGNLSNVQNMTIGIGNGDSGTGLVFIDDIGFGRVYTGPADITAAGDVVQGIPNDGDWPGAETPDLTIDDDVNTKYLHFKGATEPTGFQVTPSVGGTVVTGLTFATANDAPERDPVAFELYGSKDSIDGPYTLIASGDITDFSQETEWERFTMNSTMISFENLVAYNHYQVLFPTVRDAGSANSMQIAEVELIGVLVP